MALPTPPQIPVNGTIAWFIGGSMKHNRLASAGLIVILALSLSAFKCGGGSKNLAVASDAVAHALLNAQSAARQAVPNGVISGADELEFEGYLSKASQAGLTLDQAIRSNASASDVAAKANAFLDAFNQLNQQGLVGIKDDKLKLSISTILTGAESSVAIIVATTGGK